MSSDNSKSPGANTPAELEVAALPTGRTLTIQGRQTDDGGFEIKVAAPSSVTDATGTTEATPQGRRLPPDYVERKEQLQQARDRAEVLAILRAKGRADIADAIEARLLRPGEKA
jgi:hypothetical protein